MKKLAFFVALILSFSMIITSCDGGDSDVVHVTSTTTESPTETTATPPEQTTATEATIPLETTFPYITTMPEPPIEIENVTSSRYGYYQLTADEKSLYDLIYSSIKDFKTRITLPQKTHDDIVSKVCRLLYLEESDFFYIDEFKKSVNKETMMVSEIVMSYKYESTKVNEMNAAVDLRVDEILSKITPKMSTVDTIKLFHDQIITGTMYDITNEYAAMPYGALVAGKSLCEGYARAFAILCNKVGIENLFATGMVNIATNGSKKSEEHMWNMVKIEGIWYNIDLTWDDPNTPENQPFLGYDYICYNYFLFPNSDYGDDMTFHNVLFTLPVAKSMGHNYFVYYGYYAKSHQQAKDILFNTITYAYKNKRRFVNLRYTTPDLYAISTDKLFGEEREIFENTVTPNDFNVNYCLRREPNLNIIQIELIYPE